MTETIIFLCGVLSGLVALLLGYFIRMGLLHNREIKELTGDINSLYRELELIREDYSKELQILRSSTDDDIQNLQNRVSLTNKSIDEAVAYTDKRVDKVLDKFNIYLNKNA